MTSPRATSRSERARGCGHGGVFAARIVSSGRNIAVGLPRRRFSFSDIDHLAVELRSARFRVDDPTDAAKIFAHRVLTADETDLYWAANGDYGSNVRRCKKSGCALTPETVLSGIPQVVALKVDDTWLYAGAYLNEAVGSVIWKVAK